MATKSGEVEGQVSPPSPRKVSTPQETGFEWDPLPNQTKTGKLGRSRMDGIAIRAEIKMIKLD